VAEERPALQRTVEGESDTELKRAADIFRVGEVLGGNYEIRGALGEGAMGQVFDATDRALGRRVAIKANWPEINGPPLRNEARGLAAFQHSSLVTVYTVGVHRGIEYIVLERIYGVSLEQVLDQRLAEARRMDLDEALRILLAVAEALAVVHRTGLAHRDVKPANIMLTPDRRVVLMDFGLVLPQFDMSRQRLIAGSPPYMAPEALMNDMSTGAGQLVDIFSLGVTAYELLTGHLPRDAESLEELLRQYAEPNPDIRELRPDLPERLVKLVHEMIEKEPAARAQSADEVVWELKALLEGGRRSVQPTRRRVLVVDAEPESSEILARCARQTLKPAEVVALQDGDAAIAEIRRQEPDVLLLDFDLPGLTGMQLCTYLRGEGLAMRTIIVPVATALSPREEQLLQTMGIEEVVLKGPDTTKQIVNALERIRAR